MSMTEGAGEQDVRKYLVALRRRKWTVVFAMLTVTVGAVAASMLQDPVYASNAQVLLRPAPREGALLDAKSDREVARAIPTEIELVKSNPVRDRVRAKLGHAPPIKVKQVGNTEFIEIRAEHERPDVAAEVANTYASEYIDYRRDQVVEALLAVSERLGEKIAADEAQINALTAELAAVRPGEPLTLQQQQASSQREVLLRRVATNQESLSETQARAEAASGEAQLVTRAVAADEPFKPTPVRSGVMAAIVGLCFGLGLAFLVDYLDDTVKHTDDVAAAAGGLPLIGVIPVVLGWKDRANAVLVTLDDPASPVAEAYRTVRTSVQFLAIDHPLKLIQVTSPGAGEGKTATVANLAVAMASAGHRVVVVDCDLRRPRAHEFFGAQNRLGFTSVLLGVVSLPAAVQPVEGIPGLCLLTAGPPAPNPSELLGSPSAGEALKALSTAFDVVLVDCPPALPVTDAAALSHRVDATVVVAAANVTPRKALTRTVALLRQMNAPLVGVVLNGLSVDGANGYGYGSGYRYERQDRPLKAAEARTIAG